MLIMLLKV